MSGEALALDWRRWGLASAGGAIVVALVLAAIFAPLLAPYGPYDLDVMRMLEPPGREHWLGVDESGRDVLSRAIYAARISMRVAFIAGGIGLAVGVPVGVMAAYLGGWVDMLFMRFMELLFSFPAILLAIVLMASLGTSIFSATIAIGIVFIPGFARLARAATELVLREQYIEAARAVGMGHARIILREILPNILPPLLASAAAALSLAVLLEAALSFLGLGAQIPDASWGNMLDTGRGFLDRAPWLSIVPGVAIFVAVLGFNLLGAGLRDALDPQLRD